MLLTAPKKSALDSKYYSLDSVYFKGIT